MALICAFLAWHRQFSHLYEFNWSSALITTFGMGLPPTLLLSGVWQRIRDGVYGFVAPLIVVALCLNGVWTTIDTFMHYAISGGPTDYTEHGADILWGSYLWGCALPILMTTIVASLDMTIDEMRRHRFPLVTCALAILSAVLVNHFAIMLFTASIQEMAVFGKWLRFIGF